MNLSCIICQDVFIPSADVVSAVCGHMFHYQCIIQWIERSKTCPQCRQKITEKNLHKLFFNIARTDSDDLSTLQYKLDSVTYTLKLKDKEIENVKEKNDKLENSNKGLRHMVQNLEKCALSDQSKIHALKEQIKMMRDQVRMLESKESEILDLRKKLDTVRGVQTIVGGSSEEVKDLLSRTSSSTDLATFVVCLKGELKTSDIKRKRLRNQLHDCEYDVNRLKQELERKKNLQEELNNCLKDKESLERKLSELVKAKAYNSRIQRIVTESPAPECSKKSDNSYIESPSLQEKLKVLEDSDSPYLKIKQSTIGMKSLTSASKDSIPAPKYSIFNNCKVTNATKNLSMKSATFDGLGGRSVIDDFSNMKRPALFKRSKLSPKLRRSKVAKIDPTLKKLDSFMEKLDKTINID